MERGSESILCGGCEWLARLRNAVFVYYDEFSSTRFQRDITYNFYFSYVSIAFMA